MNDSLSHSNGTLIDDREILNYIRPVAQNQANKEIGRRGVLPLRPLLLGIRFVLQDVFNIAVEQLTQGIDRLR